MSDIELVRTIHAIDAVSTSASKPHVPVDMTHPGPALVCRAPKTTQNSRREKTRTSLRIPVHLSCPTNSSPSTKPYHWRCRDQEHSISKLRSVPCCGTRLEQVGNDWTAPMAKETVCRLGAHIRTCTKAVGAHLKTTTPPRRRRTA